MNQSTALEIFRNKAEAIGPDATDSQINRLVDWMRDNIADAYVHVAATIAIECDASVDLYTAISEYMGESGL